MPYKDLTLRNANRHPLKERFPIHYRSMDYVALCYLKMVRTPVRPADLRELSDRFKKNSDRCLAKLAQRGLATRGEDGGYTVTRLGVETMYRMARAKAVAVLDDDDDHYDDDLCDEAVD